MVRLLRFPVSSMRAYSATAADTQRECSVAAYDEVDLAFSQLRVAPEVHYATYTAIARAVELGAASEED